MRTFRKPRKVRQPQLWWRRHKNIKGGPASEIYDTFGTVALNEENFTGDTPDLGVANMFHTDNRELNTSEGRWISPDPAGAGWNLYAYTTNPNGGIDPSGLKTIPGINPSWYLGFSAFNFAMSSMNAFGQGFDNWITATFSSVPADNTPPPGSPNTNSAGSSTNSSGSSPQLCLCSNDLTVPGGVGAASMPAWFFVTPQKPAPFFELTATYDGSAPLNPQDVFNEVGARAGAAEDLIVIGAVGPPLVVGGFAAGNACALGCIAMGLTGVILYNSVNPDLEDQPANNPENTGHPPGLEPEGPSQGPAPAPITGPAPPRPPTLPTLPELQPAP